METNKHTENQQRAVREPLKPRIDMCYWNRIHGRPEPPESLRLACDSTASEIRVDQWAIDTVLDRLVGWRPCGSGYSARCPAHGDQNPSLSVGESNEGHVLLKCHAGCSIEEILNALGLDFVHLYTSEYARRFGRRRDGRIAPQCTGWPRADVSEIDFEKFAKLVAGSAVDDDEAFMPLCLATDLCVRACVEFGLGIEGSRFVFPERDDQLRPIGVVYRYRDGTKKCHPGSTRGLTIPVVDRRLGGEMYVTEGATDAMALYPYRVRAIGRPAAIPSALVFGWLTAYLVRNATDGVVIVGDNDASDAQGRRVGQDAARQLAEQLAAVLPPNISVCWALPNCGYKDIREQVTAGDWTHGLQRWEVRR